MNVSEIVATGITKSKDKDTVLRDLAKQTLHHPHPCGCPACRSFDVLAGNKVVKAKDAPAMTMLQPGLADKLSAGLKGKRVRVGDQDGRSPNPSGVHEHDDEKRPKKRKLPIDAKLARSIGVK